MVHGQCLHVGVGGYLLGGGIHIVGTTQRHGMGSANVLEYTMVDSMGMIVKVSKGFCFKNLEKICSKNNDHICQR